MAVAEHGLNTATPPVSRRMLLRALWGVGALALLAQTGVVFMDFFRPRKVGKFGSIIPVGNPADFPVGSITRVADGKFYLAHVPEGFLALFQKCPHLGCVVPWRPDDPSEDKIEEKGRFNCPCHGSIYNRYGVIVAGPAPRPMDLMEVRVEGGVILVNTSKVTQRSEFQPSQAVQA